MLRRFLRTLRAGVPVAHRRPYRFSRVLAGVMAASYIAMLILQLGNFFRPSSRPFRPLSDFSEPVPYMVMSEPENMVAIRWETAAGVSRSAWESGFGTSPAGAGTCWPAWMTVPPFWNLLRKGDPDAQDTAGEHL